MVSRQRLTRAALWLACGLAGTMGAAPLARAADAKVAIGHYRWSTPVVNIDLGQHVTWYWVGPDTMHSVTGISANDIGDDSDPNNPEPEHKLGFTYRLTFTQPGVYQFHCKLHAVVHGEVIVSDVPGNPADDPDPIPKLNVQLTRPTLNDFFLASSRFEPARGTALHFALDDPSLIDAEIWHVGPRRTPRRRMPAGSSGTRTSASTRCRSPTAAVISRRGRAATWPTSTRPTCSTTSVASAPCTSRSPRRPSGIRAIRR